MPLFRFRYCEVLEELRHLRKEIETLMSTTSNFATDIQALTAAVQANTDALGKIASLLQADAATIQSLTDQVAALKAGQAPDLTALEADIKSLQANNTTAQGLIPPPPPPAPPTGGTGTPTA